MKEGVEKKWKVRNVNGLCVDELVMRMHGNVGDQQCIIASPSQL
jgi:hypothetical protein